MRSKEGPEREEDCKDVVQLINSVNVTERKLSNLQRERKLVVFANEVLRYVNECKINIFPLVLFLNT